MADEIKQSDNVGRISPLNRSRDAGRRKRAPKVPERPSQKRRPPEGDDRPNRVDEYA